ncbi:MAG: rplC [Chlamydiia bacterium]|nr:rplC [Chlamydiia bacterium]
MTDKVASKTTNKSHINLIGKKCGMIQVFDKNGILVPCTVIHAEPNVVTQIKTEATDGYEAIQLGFGEVRVKDARTMANRVTRPLLKHFEKAGVTPRRHIVESRVSNPAEYTLGQSIGVTHFQDITHVDVSGVSKGKGFQGVMKKYGFSGGPASHGSGFHRHAGSTGMRSSPGRCLPGGPRASHMGDENVTTQGLRIVAIDEAKNLIMVEGAVPGARGGILVITQSTRKQKNKKA